MSPSRKPTPAKNPKPSDPKPKTGPSANRKADASKPANTPKPAAKAGASSASKAVRTMPGAAKSSSGKVSGKAGSKARQAAPSAAKSTAKAASVQGGKGQVAGKTGKGGVPGKAKGGGSPVADRAEDRLKPLVHRQHNTPPVFKVPNKKQPPVVFTLEDVREVLRSRSQEEGGSEGGTGGAILDHIRDRKSPASASAPKPGARITITPDTPLPPEATAPRVLGAASLADILGVAAEPRKTPASLPSGPVPRKWARYHRLLLELRDHLCEGLDKHTRETLFHSSKEDSGDLSAYSQHIADAGTETFDRDLALSLVSSEQEALTEVMSALERIHNGSYGVCEITGQTISPERLEAVPFTRYSLEGQAEVEKTRRRTVHRGHFAVDLTADEAGGIANDEGDD